MAVKRRKEKQAFWRIRDGAQSQAGLDHWLAMPVREEGAVG